MAGQLAGPEQGPPAAKAMRADARRNSERIIAVAKEVFDEQGPDAPLDEVVKRAKIGAGTLYRHFSTREKLLEAVYREEIVKLAERAYTLLDQQPAEQALAGWLRAQLRFVRQNRGLAASPKAAMDSSGETFDYCRTTMRTAATALLTPLQEAGRLRADIDSGELLRMTHAIAIATDQEGDEAADKMLSVILDGLRRRPPLGDGPSDHGA